MTSPSDSGPAAVFQKHDGAWLPTALSAGPWDPRAQHGGAAAALLAHVAEDAVPDPSWQLKRLSLELIKPVPVAPLEVRTRLDPGRSTSRMGIEVLFEGSVVASARALLVRGQPFELPEGLPGWIPAALVPGPLESGESIHIPGMPPGVSFFNTAMEHRMARGDSARPGPGAAWFRVKVPMLEGVETSPYMRVAAAADCGSGLSWVLPADKYLFANADLSLHLHRPAVGEWIGMQSETQADGGGAGTTVSRLYDVHGPIGVAVQTLVMRERRG